MDMKSADTRKTAEGGMEIHLKHPVLGHKLFVGDGADIDTGEMIDEDLNPEKVTIIVRGYHAKSVQRAHSEHTRNQMQGGQADAKEFSADLADALIVSWENVIYDGEPLTCTKKNKLKFVDLDPGIWQQIHLAAQDRKAFFKAKSTT